MPFYPLMFKAVTIDLVLVYILSDAERRATLANLTDLLNRNALSFQISDILPLEDCAGAHDMIAGGHRAGSVLLRM